MTTHITIQGLSLPMTYSELGHV